MEPRQRVAGRSLYCDVGKVPGASPRGMGECEALPSPREVSKSWLAGASHSLVGQNLVFSRCGAFVGKCDRVAWQQSLLGIDQR